MESAYTSHIKASHLKSLIQSEGNCQEKLSKISELVGLPGPVDDKESTINNETGSQVNEVEEAERQKLERREECYKKILEGLSGKNEKLARGLLQRIETCQNLSFDYGTLEISINGIRKSNSSIRSLVHRMITVASPQLPICLTEFINGLIDNSVPISYYQNADCLQIRLSLINIKKNGQLSNDNAVENVNNIEEGGNQINTAPPPVSGEEGVATVRNNEASETSPPVELKSIRKRSRVEDADDQELERDRKRVKFEENDAKFDGKVNKKKRAREIDEEEEKNEKPENKKKKTAAKKVKATGTRRSKRLQLKEEIASDWVS